MAKKLYTKINMFDLAQTVFLVKDEKVTKMTSVPTDELGTTFASLVETQDVDEIELDGNTLYTQKIGQEILENITRLYSNNKNVRININGKIFN